MCKARLAGIQRIPALVLSHFPSDVVNAQRVVEHWVSPWWGRGSVKAGHSIRSDLTEARAVFFR